MRLEGREITRGLAFPEGPIALIDGSLIVVEIEGGRSHACCNLARGK